MPETKSERKRLSNLANAQKSTGPKTPQGLARSAQNARKHGILSNEVVIRDGDGRESAAEFVELVESLHAQLRPQDAVEHFLVDRVAACYWRLCRAQRYEVGAVRERLDDCKTPLDGLGPNMQEHGRRVRMMQMRLAVEKHVLEESGATCPDSRRPPPRVAPDASAEESDHHAAHCVNPATNKPPAPKSEDRFAKVEAAIREYESITELAEMRDIQADSRRPLLGSLPDDEHLDRLIRYETMLDRQLHRALSELRRRRSGNSPMTLDDPDVKSPGVQ